MIKEIHYLQLKSGVFFILDLICFFNPFTPYLFWRLCIILRCVIIDKLCLCSNVLETKRAKAILIFYLYFTSEILGTLYRIIILHDENNTEPYVILNVILSNTFNLKSNECISASSSYPVVLTQTRNPSEENQRKISDDLKKLGIDGLQLTDLSG